MVRALAYVLGHRFWQGIAGIGTILVVTRYISVDEQGFFYAFASLAAVSVLFDLGISSAVFQRTASEFSFRQSSQECEGQLYLIVNQYRNFYVGAVSVFLVFSIIFGWAAFHGASALVNNSWWFLIWLVLILLSAGNLWFVPYFAALEGSGQINYVYRVRIWQSLAGSFLTWMFLIGGQTNISVLASPAVSILFSIILIRPRIKATGRLLTKKNSLPDPSRIFYKEIVIVTIFSYLTFQLSPTILFRLDMASEAGRMGVSLSIFNMIALIATSPVTVSATKLAKLARRGRDAIFWRMSVRLILLVAIAYIGLSAIVIAVLFSDWGIIPSRKIFDFHQFLFLGWAVFCYQCANTLILIIRTRHREPFAYFMILQALFSNCLLFTMVPSYGMTYFLLVFSLLQTIIFLPWAAHIFNSSKVTKC